MNLKFITPGWKLSKHIHAVTTTRMGGFSQIPFDSFNLALHVGDSEESVLKNRALLSQTLKLPSEPVWLNQQHTNRVIDAAHPENLNADGSYTNKKNMVCVVMTADCLPILLCNKNETEIAALHAGWKGLLNGIVENGVKRFESDKKDIVAYLGPAISQSCFEVGEEVRDGFVHLLPELKSAFKNSKPEKFLMDIYSAAKIILYQQGITDIYNDSSCTYQQKELFYSYRREKITGRIATLIWMSND